MPKSNNAAYPKHQEEEETSLDSQKDTKFGQQIQVGHCDLYFMVE